MNWNRYKRKTNTKTAFVSTEGEPLFTGSIYLVKPYYIKRNSPAFTLVSRGKHITGFFPFYQDIYSGDYQKHLLIILKSNEDEFELIQTDLPVNEGRKLLAKGDLNSLIASARNKGLKYK